MAKKCTIGKSCGGSCVSKSYLCEKDVPKKAKEILAELKKQKERKESLKEKLDEQRGFASSRDNLATLQTSYEVLREVAMQDGNLDVIAAAIATRERISEVRKAEKENNLKEEEEIEARLKDSPKYDKIPGKNTPLKAESYEDAEKSLEAELVLWKKQAQAEGLYRKENFDRWADEQRRNLYSAKTLRDSAQTYDKIISGLEKDIETAKAKGAKPEEIFRLTLDRDSAVAQKEKLANTLLPSPGLRMIYRRQGYNARPEMVRKISDLEKRNDLLKNEDGNVIAYRGVTEVKFADQFRWGPEHYPGSGIFGNGSYSAAPSEGHKSSGLARTEARDYSNTGERRSLIAFGIKAEARILDIKDAQKRAEFVSQARKETKTRYDDIGEAAAAMGYDALRMGAGREVDYFIILNRGATVVAAEGAGR